MNKKASLPTLLVFVVIAGLIALAIFIPIFLKMGEAGKSAESLEGLAKFCPDTALKAGDHLKAITLAADETKFDDPALVVGDNGNGGLYYGDFLPCKSVLFEVYANNMPLFESLEKEIDKCVLSAYESYATKLEGEDPELQSKINRLKAGFETVANRRYPGNNAVCQYVEGDSKYDD